MEYAAMRYMEHMANHDRLVATALCGCADAKAKLGMAGIDYSGGGGHSGIPDDGRIPESLHRLAEAYDAAEAELEAYDTEMARCKEALASVGDEVYRCLLKCRYLYGLRWQETAECIGYSVAHSKAMRRHALIALYPYIPEEWKANLPNAQPGRGFGGGES